MKERIKKLEEALQRIATWHGEFPDTGLFWDGDKTRPMSYAAAYGSNGEINFMRNIAYEALNSIDKE